MKSKRLVGIVIVCLLLLAVQFVSASIEGEKCHLDEKEETKTSSDDDDCGAIFMCLQVGFSARWREHDFSNKDKCEFYESCNKVYKCEFNYNGQDLLGWDTQDGIDIFSPENVHSTERKTYYNGAEDVELYDVLIDNIELVDLAKLAIAGDSLYKNPIAGDYGGVVNEVVNDLFGIIELTPSSEATYYIKEGQRLVVGDKLSFEDLNQFVDSNLRVYDNGFMDFKEGEAFKWVEGDFSNIIKNTDDGSYILDAKGKLEFINEEGEASSKLGGKINILLDGVIDIESLIAADYNGNAKFTHFDTGAEVTTLPNASVVVEFDENGDIESFVLEGDAIFKPDIEDLGEEFLQDDEGNIIGNNLEIRSRNADGDIATGYYKDGKFSYVENLVGDYIIYDLKGDPVTVISSISNEEPITVYSDPLAFADYVGENGGNYPTWRTQEENNVIYASVNHDAIAATGFYEIKREKTEQYPSLYVSSTKDSNSLFLYGKTQDADGKIVEKTASIGIITIKDDDDLYEGLTQHTTYSKTSSENSETVDIDVLPSFQITKPEEDIAYFGKRVYDANGNPVMISSLDIMGVNAWDYVTEQTSEELIVGHTIGIKDDGTTYFSLDDTSYDLLGGYIDAGNEANIRRKTNITTFGTNEKYEGSEYVMNADGLNEVFTGANGTELKVLSPEGIKFKVCSEEGQSCGYLTCCEMAGRCGSGSSETVSSYAFDVFSLSGSGGITGSYKTCIIDDEYRDAHPDWFDEDGNLIDFSGDIDISGEEFSLEEELMLECEEPCTMMEGEECVSICEEEEECLGEEGFENCYITECESEYEEFDFEELECVVVECEPGFELNRYDDCEEIECPEGKVYDVIEQECMAEKEEPALELLLNDENKDIILEAEDDKEVIIVGRVVEGDSDARVSIKVDGKEIKSGYDEITATYTFVYEKDKRYHVNFEYPESDGYLTDSVDHEVIVKGANEGPTWLGHGTNPISDSPYSATQEHNFSIEWEDEAGIKKVEFENDFTGATTKQIVEVGDDGNYTYTTTRLSMGIYNYRWYATNNKDLTSSTENILYKVGKGDPSITVKINGEPMIGEQIQLYKGNVGFEIIVDEPQDGKSKVVFGGQLMPVNVFSINMDKFGIYPLTVTVLESDLYELKEFKKYINITQLEPEIYIKINDTDNQDVVELVGPNVEFNVTLQVPEEGLLSIFLDDGFIETIDQTVDFSTKFTRGLIVGEHKIKATFHGTEVYKPFSYIKTVNVVAES